MKNTNITMKLYSGLNHFFVKGICDDILGGRAVIDRRKQEYFPFDLNKTAARQSMTFAGVELYEMDILLPERITTLPCGGLLTERVRIYSIKDL